METGNFVEPLPACESRSKRVNINQCSYMPDLLVVSLWMNGKPHQEAKTLHLPESLSAKQGEVRSYPSSPRRPSCAAFQVRH